MPQDTVKAIVILCMGVAMLVPVMQPVHAQILEVHTDNMVYTDGQPIFVYGKSLNNENLITRLISPDGSIAKFGQITTDGTGTFYHMLHMWPATSIDFPYGTYVVEVISPTQNGLSREIAIKFSSSTDLVEVPVERHVNTLVFAPETAAINNPVRIFVQTTSDGLLVGENNPDQLLQTSHVHRPDGQVDSISSEFLTLHNGLYYTDYTPSLEGTYVFHIVSFNQGSVSHGSAATSVLSQDLGGISQEIVRLNDILDETADELDTLKTEVQDFGIILDRASTNIDSSVTTISDSVQNTAEASTQLNALLFPIVSSIGIIVALQIVILARRRH